MMRDGVYVHKVAVHIGEGVEVDMIDPSSRSKGAVYDEVIVVGLVTPEIHASLASCVPRGGLHQVGVDHVLAKLKGVPDAEL